MPIAHACTWFVLDISNFTLILIFMLNVRPVVIFRFHITYYQSNYPWLDCPYVSLDLKVHLRKLQSTWSIWPCSWYLTYLWSWLFTHRVDSSCMTFHLYIIYDIECLWHITVVVDSWRRQPLCQFILSAPPYSYNIIYPYIIHTPPNLECALINN